MATLSCIRNLMEPGNFGSDSGTIVIPSGDIPFPITASGAFRGYGMTWGNFVKPGSTPPAFRGYSGSYGFFVRETPANADQDDLFVILY